jgi:hypothetical protein
MNIAFYPDLLYSSLSRICTYFFIIPCGRTPKGILPVLLAIWLLRVAS